jgi:hypothetical protein
MRISRRAALKLLAVGSFFRKTTFRAFAEDRFGTKAAAEFLTATLRWNYPNKLVGDTLSPFHSVKLEVSTREDMGDEVVSTKLAEDEDSFRLAVAPETIYYWRLTPFRKEGEESADVSTGSFHTGAPVFQDTEDDRIRYQNPRTGAHWLVSKDNGVVPFAIAEPLSPWFSEKSYLGPTPPQFDEVKKLLPVPVLGVDTDLIELYWYCWKTLFDVWMFPPTAPDHQAVANLVGVRTWGDWGSTMVWDTAFILHFARYAHHAYPMITTLDNCYARQHENGFICRESDSQNREVYALFPLNPALFSWAEWENFEISGDSERLARVLTPIVKHYEWWMKYQRRSNGLYWTNGFNEADDSPRNELMYFAVSAASYQALAALYIAKIARHVGRNDLVNFLEGEHASLGQVVNSKFWDANHSLYNDLDKEGRFITELQPGVFCKHAHMFWPLLAQIADQKGIDGIVAELMNPKSFYRSSGIPSLSADSKGYREDGQYWKGSVWPPIQCMVQEGLRLNGRWTLARGLAQKYLYAVLEAYQHERTITENLAPDTPKGYGMKDFVGWGGIGPVSDLIEYVLGLQINAPEKSVEWRIQRTDRHGVSQLPIGAFTASLICEKRTKDTDPCRLTVESGGDFTLKVMVDEKTTVHSIHAGRNEAVVS